MLETKIVDRTVETNLLIQSINLNLSQKESCAYFIVADTGFGKSSIIKKAQKSADLMTDLIIVDTPPINRTQATLEGQYISYIAEALNCCGKCDSLKDYLINCSVVTPESTVYTKKEFETIIDTGHTAYSALTAWLGHPQLIDLDSKRMLLKLDADSILILKEYITYVLKSSKITLSITNAQNMDTTTIRLLKEIFSLLPHLFIIFEYTTISQDREELYKFAGSFNVSTEFQYIPSLSLEYALTLVQPQNTKDIKEFENFYNKIVEGNLYRLEQWNLNLVDGQCNYTDDPIALKLTQLSYGAKLVLSIIMFHDGDIEISRLKEIIKLFSEEYYIAENWQIELETLLKNNDGRLTLNHASISDAFSLNTDNYAAMAAYRYVEPYYRNKCLTCNGIEMQKSLVILLKMYALFCKENLPSLFEKFKGVIVSSLSEEDAFTFVKKGFDAISKNDNRELQLNLVNICYNMGLYDGAQELMELLTPLTTPYEKALYFIILNRNDFHQKVIKLCRQEIKRTKDAHAVLLFSMIQMLSERSINHFRKCRWIYYKLRWSHSYHKYLEYGFLLRNSQIVLSYSKSIPQLEKSISFFEKRGKKIYAAMSQLTLLIQNARIGNLKGAETKLKNIQTLLENESFEKHIIYVNEAAIRLLEHKADEETIALLEKAKLTVTTTFDRLVILNNYIAACILNNSLIPNFADFQEQVLLTLSHEPDARMKKKTYTNLYLYYKSIGKPSQATFWKKKAMDIRIISSAPGIEEVLLGDRKAKRDEKYLSEQEFIVGFITYWHFPVPLDDQSLNGEDN